MIVSLTNKLFEKLKRKTYRDAYVAESARTGIAYQIRAMREQRAMQQGQLASQLGKPQSVVSRLENPDYGKYTLSSLLEVAAAFDVALVVRFVSYPDFLRFTSNVKPEALEVESFDPSAFCESVTGRVITDVPEMWTAPSGSRSAAEVQLSTAPTPKAYVH